MIYLLKIRWKSAAIPSGSDLLNKMSLIIVPVFSGLFCIASAINFSKFLKLRNDQFPLDF